MSDSRSKLRGFLNKRNANNGQFTDELNWIESMNAWIHYHCPTVQTHVLKGKTIAWLIVQPSEDILSEIRTHDIRIIINIDKSYDFQVLKTTVKTGQAKSLSNRELILPLLHSFEPGSKYTICKGISAEDADTFGDNSRSVRRHESLERTDSPDCDLWIKRDVSISMRTKTENIGRCKHCATLSYRVSRYIKNNAALDKTKRTEPNSKCNFRFLSAKESAKRKAARRYEVCNLKRIISRLSGEV